MDRLSELLNNYGNQTMEIELVDLLIAELNARTTTTEFLGEQLMTIKAENALLKQQLLSKRVN